MNKSKKICALGLVASAALATSGCVTDAMVMEEQAMMEQEDSMMMDEKNMMMQSSIDEAMRKANSAAYNADIAKQMADEALNRLNMMESHMMKRGMKKGMMK